MNYRVSSHPRSVWGVQLAYREAHDLRYTIKQCLKRMCGPLLKKKCMLDFWMSVTENHQPLWAVQQGHMLTLSCIAWARNLPFSQVLVADRPGMVPWRWFAACLVQVDGLDGAFIRADVRMAVVKLIKRTDCCMTTWRCNSADSKWKWNTFGQAV